MDPARPLLTQDLQKRLNNETVQKFGDWAQLERWAEKLGQEGDEYALLRMLHVLQPPADADLVAAGIICAQLRIMARSEQPEKLFSAPQPPDGDRPAAVAPPRFGFEPPGWVQLRNDLLGFDQARLSDFRSRLPAYPPSKAQEQRQVLELIEARRRSLPDGRSAGCCTAMPRWGWRSRTSSRSRCSSPPAPR